jgi:hypothetical protein
MDVGETVNRANEARWRTEDGGNRKLVIPMGALAT